MATELIGTARQEANKETVKRHPGLARAPPPAPER